MPSRKLSRPPRRATGSEHDEQTALFNWARLTAVEWPALAWMFAIPNGGERHPLVAVKLRDEGVRAGVPDMFLPAPVAPWHGLFIELKAGRNKTTEQQTEWLAALRAAGYQTVVSYGWEAAARDILDYLGASQAQIDRALGDAVPLEAYYDAD